MMQRLWIVPLLWLLAIMPATAQCPDGLCECGGDTDVNNGVCLTNAVTTAVCGDTIQLAAGEGYSRGGSGNYSFTLPDKSCSGYDQIILQSDDMDSLPAGQRIDPATQSGSLATVYTTDTQFPLEIEGDGWTVRGLDITTDESQDVNRLIGVGGDDVTLDRNWIHPPEVTAMNLVTPIYTRVNFAFSLSALRTRITNNAIYAGGYRFGTEMAYVASNAVGIGWSGGADTLVENNYLEAFYNPLFLGGNDYGPTPEHTATCAADPAPTLTSCTIVCESPCSNDIVVGDYVAFRIRSDDFYLLEGGQREGVAGVGEITSVDGNALEWTRLHGANPVWMDVPCQVMGMHSEAAEEVTVDTLTYTGALANFVATNNGAGQNLGHKVVIDGHMTEYEVTATTTFSGGVATIPISPGLEDDIADNTDCTLVPQNAGYIDFDVPPLSDEESHVVWRGHMVGGVQILRNHIVAANPARIDVLTGLGGAPKGYFEIKGVDGLLIEGNVFESSIATRIFLYSQNQNGFMPWARASNTTIRNNLVDSMGCLVDMPVGSSYNPSTGESDNTRYLNNLVIGGTPANTPGAAGSTFFCPISGAPTNVLIQHNTMTNSGEMGPIENGARPILQLADNAFRHAGSIWNCGVALSDYPDGDCFGEEGDVTIETNLIIDRANLAGALGPNWGEVYGGTNAYSCTTDNCAGFAGLGEGDVRLLPTSPGYQAASDGKNMGVDVFQLYQAVNASDWPFSWSPSTIPVVIEGAL